jgi:hypothetical protein
MMRKISRLTVVLTAIKAGATLEYSKETTWWWLNANATSQRVKSDVGRKAAENCDQIVYTGEFVSYKTFTKHRRIVNENTSDS